MRAPRRGTGGVRMAGSSVGRDVWVVRDLGGRGGVWECIMEECSCGG